MLVALMALVFLSVGEVETDVNVSARVTADSVTVGDHIPFVIIVTHPDTITFSALEGEKKLDNVFLLGGNRKSVAPLEGELVEDSLFAFVVPFETGEVTIPPVEVFYETDGGIRGSLESDSSIVYVKSVLPDSAADIKPLKPIIPGPSDVPSYLLMGIIACLLFLAAFLAIRFARRKKTGPLQELYAPAPRPAHEIAFEELRAIEELELLSQGRFKEYYSLLSLAVRRYIGNRFGFETLDLTTFELVGEMRKRDLERSTIGEFKSFLGTSDLVKFAKFMPSFGEMESAIETCRGLVRKTAAREEEDRDHAALADVAGGNG